MDHVAALLAQSRDPAAPTTIAICGVIGKALAQHRQPLIRGLSEDRFQALLDEYFKDVSLTNGTQASADIDEFDELLELLLEYRAEPSERLAWVAHAIASAAMRENHLWQDMGLPSRKHMSELLQTCFPALAAKNEGSAMKWKKFLYRQLCERANVPICKSPHCAECADYAECFMPVAADVSRGGGAAAANA